MTAREKIRTPKGKTMTPRQYIALVQARNIRDLGGAPPCQEGHYGCAAWADGPCSAMLEMLDATYNTAKE